MAKKFRYVAGYVYRDGTRGAVAYVTTAHMTRKIVRLLNADAKKKRKR